MTRTYVNERRVWRSRWYASTLPYLDGPMLKFWDTSFYALAHPWELTTERLTVPRSDAEFLAKMGDCLKELEESLYWLELLHEGEIVAFDRLAPVLDETNELIAIFVTIINRRRSNLGLGS